SNCKIPTLLSLIFNLKNSIIYFFNLIIRKIILFYFLLSNLLNNTSLKSLNTTKYNSNEIQSQVDPVKFSFRTNIRSFSTLELKENFKLDPYWITGFTDAEGCFSVIIEMSSLLKWKVR